MPSADSQLGDLEREIESLKARIALPASASQPGEQAQILHHFLDRALQMSVGCDLLCRARLGTPLAALMRILCEDLFLCLWVALSEKDAAEYARAVASESIRLVRAMLENGRERINHIQTGEDKTAEVPRRAKGSTTNRIKIEQLAKRLGLSKVYDLVYRYPSMAFHGIAFGLASPREEEEIYNALSAIVSIVKGIRLIVDNRVLQNRATRADEIMCLMGIEGIAGK